MQKKFNSGFFPYISFISFFTGYYEQ